MCECGGCTSVECVCVYLCVLSVCVYVGCMSVCIECVHVYVSSVCLCASICGGVCLCV